MMDICFILEGTYPYVAGGVSTWVHQLIQSMKDMRVAIVYIGAHSDPTRTLKYEMPEHVMAFKEIYLHDYNLKSIHHRRPRKEDYLLIKNIYENLIQERYDSLREALALFQGENSCFDIPNFFSSKQIWNFLLEGYQRFSPHISFMDFFWTWRGIHLPLLNIFQSDLPKARIYHSISTGYAGFVATLAKIKYDQKFFLTEHGLYTHERMLEISQATWIYEQEVRRYRAESDLSFFKKWWIELFRTLSRIAYHYADQIYTLYEGNRLRQIAEGAASEKTGIIPNGISLDEFEKLKRTKKSVPQIGFIGRVVRIKDVKAFIQSAKIILQKYPGAQFYIVGPTDEEEDYYDECLALVSALDVNDKITFTGRASVMDYYSFLDVLVLTSLSEAQPYVILEANMAGIPVVSTDVGACREMLVGRDSEDQELGESGIVTEVANPSQTAQAVIKILSNKELYQSMSRAGQLRVKKYYDQNDLLSRYLNVYEKNI